MNQRFGVSSSTAWIPVCFAVFALISAIAFLYGRRIGNNLASQKHVSYDKLEFELLYLQEKLDWAIEGGDSKESARLEKLLTTKKTNLESRKDAVDMLEKSQVTWDAKRMKAKIHMLEERQSDLTEKSKTREEVVKSLHEDNTLKQLKIEMLEEIVRTISGAMMDEGGKYASKSLLLSPSKDRTQAPIVKNAYAKNLPHVINSQKVFFTGPLREGIPNGVGTIRFQDKSTYIGSIVDGKMHGNGALFMHTGIVKRGRFTNNEFISCDDSEDSSHDDDTASLRSSLSSSERSRVGPDSATRQLRGSSGIPTPKKVSVTRLGKQ